MADILAYRFDKPMKPDDIRLWRERLGLVQSDAGILLGCHERTIGAYENGERPIPVLVQVSCFAFEHWPWLKLHIPRIISDRSK